MVVPLVAKVSGNDDYRRAVVSRGIPLQGTGAFGMLLDLGGPPVGLVEGGAGEGVEHPAAGVTAGVEDRGAVPPVDLQAIPGPAPRAGEPFGVKGINEFLVAGVLVHELGDR